MLYFLFWLAITMGHAVNSINLKYLIFLTHWGFITWNSYLVLSTATITAAFCQDNWSKSDHKKSATPSSSDQLRYNGCRTMLSPLDVAYKIQWSLFLVGGEYAVVITTLYWVFYSGANSEQNLYSLDSLNLHTVNGISAIVDLWLSGMPVRVYHAVYSIAFGCVYVLFTGLYYVTGGRDPEGNHFIYPFLDYGSNPRAAIALAVSCTLLFVGSVHFVFFLHYVVRKFITGKFHLSHYNQDHKSSTVTSNC